MRQSFRLRGAMCGGNERYWRDASLLGSKASLESLPKAGAGDGQSRVNGRSGSS